MMMIIGVLELEVSIDGAFSLKEKRMVVNRIRDRVRQKFNVAIAEVEDQDVWNRATFGIVGVSNDQQHTNRVLSKIVDLIKTIRDCEVEDYTIQFV